jgi:hypothetical protein
MYRMKMELIDQGLFLCSLQRLLAKDLALLRLPPHRLKGRPRLPICLSRILGWEMRKGMKGGIRKLPGDVVGVAWPTVGRKGVE